LDSEARRSLLRMGDKSRAFVRMLPRAFDLEEFGRDVALDEALLPIAESVRQLAEMIDDTHTAVCSDAYVAALMVYQSAKRAGKGTGLDGALDGLGRRFVRKSGGMCQLAPLFALFEFLSKLRQNGLHQRWRDEQASVAQRLINRRGGFQRGSLSSEGDNSDGSDHGNRKEGCRAPSGAVVDDHSASGLLQSRREHLTFTWVESPSANCFGYLDVGLDLQAR